MKNRSRPRTLKPPPKSAAVLRADPTRTTVLRGAFASSLGAAFAAVAKTVSRVVGDEDAFGLKSQSTTNADTTHEFASTHFVIDDPEILRAVKEMQDRLDPADVVKLEDRPHVTVRYGLHDDPSNPLRVENIVKHSGPVFASTGPLSLFTSVANAREAESVANVFCATGEGGGVDPTCGVNEKRPIPPATADNIEMIAGTLRDALDETVGNPKDQCIACAYAVKQLYPQAEIYSGAYFGEPHTLAKLGGKFIDVTADQFDASPKVQTLDPDRPLPQGYRRFMPDAPRDPAKPQWETQFAIAKRFRELLEMDAEAMRQLSTNAEPKPDVLKVTVVGWKLHDLNRKLKAVEHTDTFPEYRPHMTVAYLKPGTGHKYFGLQQFLPPGTTLRFTNMAYSDANRHETDVTLNVFCATGEGGGVDPTCSNGSGVITDKHGVSYQVVHTSHQQKADERYEPAAFAAGVVYTRHRYGIKTADGKRVGEVELARKGKSVMHVAVDPEFQRRGIATAVYAHIEKHLGVNLEENATTDDGEKFWASRRLRGLTGNTRWSGQPPSQKVNSFGAWLNALVSQTVTGPKARNAWDVYLKTGFKKGVTSSYTDVAKADRASVKKTATTLGWYSGAKDQFVQSAMGNPLTADKVKMLANQTFDHLTDVTSTMSTRISRVLTDGLIKGLSPKAVASNIVTEVGLAKQRALLIAQTECLPAESLIDGAVVRAVFRRWYEGPMVDVVTRLGRKFTATPNHPVLTGRGWIGLGEVNQTDHLVCRSRKDESCSAGNPHHHDRPTSVGEVFRSLENEWRRERKFGTCNDFHGDGSDRDVEILTSHRSLEVGEFTPVNEHTSQDILTLSDLSRAGLCPKCGRLLTINQGVCFCLTPQGNAGLLESRLDPPAVDSELVGELAHGLTGQVAVLQGVNIHVTSELVGNLAPHPGVQLTLGVVPTDTGLPENTPDPALVASRLFGDLPLGESGQVELDDVLAVSMRRFAGHVYNLETSYGYYTADSVYTKNCIRAHAEGQLTALEAAGVEQVSAAAEYDTTGDGKVCPKCRPLDGVVLTVPEARGMIPRHPRCRCAWKPAVVKQPGMITGAGAIKKAMKRAGAEPNSPIAKARPELMSLNQLTTPFGDLLAYDSDPLAKYLLGLLAVVEPVFNYFDPSQPRDAKGRWGTGGFRHDVSTPMSHLAQLGGSTGATLVSIDGKKWVKKSGGGAKGDHIESEHHATKAYQAVGADVPGSSLHKANDAAENVSKLSRYVTGGQTYAEFKQTATPDDLAKMKKEAGRHFAMDALLGNWDVVGMSGDNMIIKNSRVYRIDNGGALKYRAQGQLKTPDQFGPSVPELHTMRDPSKNQMAAEVFGHLTDAQVAHQMRKILKDKDKILAAIPEAYGKGTIEQRINTFKTLLQVGFGKTPTNGPDQQTLPAAHFGHSDDALEKLAHDKASEEMKMGPGDFKGKQLNLFHKHKAKILAELKQQTTAPVTQKVKSQPVPDIPPFVPTPKLPTPQEIPPATTAHHLHSADGLESYVKSKKSAGPAVTDLYMKKLKYLNPNGTKDGEVILPWGSGTPTHLEMFKKILPAGTVIKKHDVFGKDLEAGTPFQKKAKAKVLDTAAGGDQAGQVPAPPPAPKVVPPPTPPTKATQPQPVHAEVGQFGLDETKSQVLKKVAEGLGTLKDKAFGPVHAKNIQSGLKEQAVYMSLHDVAEGLKSQGFTVKPNAVFDKTTPAPEPGRLTKEQKKANLAANTSVVENPDGTRTTTYYGHTFTQSPKVITTDQLKEQAPNIPGSGSDVHLPNNHVWDKEEHKEWVKNLTPEQKNVISSWKGSSGSVRRHVAKHAGDGTAATDPKTTALMSALASQPPQPGVYYRGVSGAYANNFVETAKKVMESGRGWVADQLPHGLSGNSGTSVGFASGHTFLRIVSKSARPIVNAPGGYASEAELIVPPLTRYRVKAVHDGVKVNGSKLKHVIELEEI
jgi:GNAT superfamily N-acetyltransferase